MNHYNGDDNDALFAEQAASTDASEIHPLPLPSLEDRQREEGVDAHVDTPKDNGYEDIHQDISERKLSKKLCSMIALGTLLALILFGVIMRVVMSRTRGNDKPKELTRQQEAAYCSDRGCLNMNCLRIDACHTDPDSAYCADSGCINSDCPLTGDCAVDGRPFRENTSSQPLLAETTTSCRDCPWSSTQDTHPPSFDMDVVSTWSDRAIGEHASIASFAAFTIALLTHDAPPDLVADALQAASDELRHARLAFGRASAANGGMGLGPTGLPESLLQFKHDLSTLAKAVAQEGCIDETLSALQLAQESEHEIGDRDLLWGIARDEARHSLLAWRTLHWVCVKDATACHTTIEEVLHPDRLRTAVEQRFGRRPQRSSEPLGDAFFAIMDHLTPSVRDRPVECPTYVPGASAVDTLAMDIIRGFCRPAMAA